LSNIQKINDMIDSVLQSAVQRVDGALYELDSSMQAGNQNASPAYVLSQIEKASSSATEFSTAFNNFIADGPNSTHAEIIRTVNVLLALLRMFLATLRVSRGSPPMTRRQISSSTQLGNPHSQV
jgi:hypothetical protein